MALVLNKSKASSFSLIVSLIACGVMCLVFISLGAYVGTMIGLSAIYGFFAGLNIISTIASLRKVYHNSGYCVSVGWLIFITCSSLFVSTAYSYNVANISYFQNSIFPDQLDDIETIAASGTQVSGLHTGSIESGNFSALFLSAGIILLLSAGLSLLLLIPEKQNRNSQPSEKGSWNSTK
ncbi:hypothetical protein AYI68_g4226 [Smittium mucronatum]|uniref:Uncharacterized protein n=1 Tax=Smittium mucronatum TaxID=133383 RepID=A0A1R0GXS6_9FUNG|nr:hypothetical protein AYI68_g4226 [Smittium mucronatum]